MHHERQVRAPNCPALAPAIPAHTHTSYVRAPPPLTASLAAHRSLAKKANKMRACAFNDVTSMLMKPLLHRIGKLADLPAEDEEPDKENCAQYFKVILQAGLGEQADTKNHPSGLQRPLLQCSLYGEMVYLAPTDDDDEEEDREDDGREPEGQWLWFNDDCE